VADIVAALSREFPADHRPSVAELAPIDQFHTRGLAATADLAEAAHVSAEMHVLDLGSGLGGPARYLASTYGCTVTGIDLSVPFVEAARVLTERTGLSEKVTFQAGNALDLPFADGTFDLVWMQHVVMNVADRTALYAGIRRVLRPGGRLATYDVIRGSGAMLYPAPWARDESTSFLLTENQTRQALELVGFRAVAWRLETDVALAWFKTQTAATGSTRPGFDLTLAMGPGFSVAIANHRRNLKAGAIEVLTAVLDGT
jgi:ubiquinone/menaquinone biosynthesis C-methylase UbiE